MKKNRFLKRGVISTLPALATMIFFQNCGGFQSVNQLLSSSEFSSLTPGSSGGSDSSGSSDSESSDPGSGGSYLQKLRWNDSVAQTTTAPTILYCLLAERRYWYSRART